jgi:hypothetical protein
LEHQVYGKYSIRVHHDPNEKFGSKHVCKILDGQCRCKCHTGPFFWKPETWQGKDFGHVEAEVKPKTSGYVDSNKRTDYDKANNLQWFGHIHGKTNGPKAWRKAIAYTPKSQSKA